MTARISAILYHNLLMSHLVMPALVAGIHVLFLWPKNVDGRDAA